MYYVIRLLVRLALRIYCPHIRVNGGRLLQIKGPLILASNHPNSFFDAIILASLIKRPVHFLATGELTDKFIAARFVEILKIIPVYRLHDKHGNQERNEKSLTQCVDILLNNGIVLVFPEAICENSWQLRPFKKLTARIALTAFRHSEMQSKLQVIPVGLNYNSYQPQGKTVLVQSGKPIAYRNLPSPLTESEKINALNELLKEALSSSVLHAEKNDDRVQILISNCQGLLTDQVKNLQEKLTVPENQLIASKIIKPGFLISGEHSLLRNLILIFLLAAPAALGWALHVFIYYPVKSFVVRKTLQSVYFDSILFAGLFLIYPLYWIVWNIAGYLFFRNLWLQIVLLFMPLLAWTTVCYKESWQRIRNYFILSRQDRRLMADFVK